MKIFRKMLRSLLFLSISVAIGLLTTTILWLPFAILSVFFLAVDVFQVNKAPQYQLNMEKELSSNPPGKLGNYVVDSTESYGMFLVLRDSPVFVDLREDELLQEREKYANYLFEKTESLEENLGRFLEVNPEYFGRQLTYIGLHTEEVTSGEVFWEPEGHSKIRGLEFSLE